MKKTRSYHKIDSARSSALELGFTFQALVHSDHFTVDVLASYVFIEKHWQREQDPWNDTSE